jgi:hypothetical protein
MVGSDVVPLPAQMALKVAITPGPMARVTGAMNGFLMFGPRIRDEPIGIGAFAQIYFPPLAWQLCDPFRSTLLDAEGWVDVTNWLEISPLERAPLSSLCSSLPVVVHPHQQVGLTDHWVEMFSDEFCFIVESDNALSHLKSSLLRES